MQKWGRLRGGYLAGTLVAICALAGVAAAQSPVASAPTGWFGVTLSDDGTLDERGTVFFEGYPMVSAVERGSPAAKAGVMPGDILMSFNSQDMRGNAFQVRSRLKPGAPFVIRLRRNDAIHVMRGTLGTPPEGWENRIVVDIGEQQPFERRTGSPSRSSEPSTRRVMIRTPMPSKVPPALIPAFTFGGGVYPFAGMEVIALNEDIRAILGVKPEGVFVTNVVEGTPARIAGLKGGDVLVQADSVRLETPMDLVQAISKAEGRTIRLRVVRKRRTQTLTLSW
jgi:S1-C subfamily serine protease